MMRGNCLHLLESRIELLAQRVSLSERLVGRADELADALARAGRAVPRGGGPRAGGATRRSPTGATSRCWPSACGRRARTTPEGYAAPGELLADLRLAQRLLRGGQRRVRRRDAAPRHDPPGRGVRLPLRAPRRARARRRGTARRSPRCCSALGVHEAYAALAPAERAALLAREIAERRPLVPSDLSAFSPATQEVVGTFRTLGELLAGATPARSSPTSCRAPRSRRTCSRCCC